MTAQKYHWYYEVDNRNLYGDSNVKLLTGNSLQI